MWGQERGAMGACVGLRSAIVWVMFVSPGWRGVEYRLTQTKALASGLHLARLAHWATLAQAGKLTDAAATRSAAKALIANEGFAPLGRKQNPRDSLNMTKICQLSVEINETEYLAWQYWYEPYGSSLIGTRILLSVAVSECWTSLWKIQDKTTWFTT